MSEITCHNIGTMEIVTKQSGDSQWIQITAYDASGIKDIELTLFAKEGKGITLKLGEDE